VGGEGWGVRGWGGGGLRARMRKIHNENVLFPDDVGVCMLPILLTINTRRRGRGRGGREVGR
jgi:hypothetical protein